MGIGTVLVVDDEHAIISAIRRLLELDGWAVLSANSADEAMEVLRENDVAVLLTDNRMPGESGLHLLERARAFRPDTVRILLTGYADLPTAMEAINHGEVFRFVLKPWVDADLLAIVTEACERHRLIMGLRSGSDGTVRSLAQAVELKDHNTRGHCDRVAGYALSIATALGWSEADKHDLRYGSWLHDCGKIGVPGSILNFPGRLTPEMYTVIRRHPGWGADLGRQAGLGSPIINIILHHHERMDGSGYPAGLIGEAIPIEARIVAVADVFDAMTTERSYKRGLSFQEGADELRRLRGTGLDPLVADAFLDLLHPVGAQAVSL